MAKRKLTAEHFRLFSPWEVEKDREVFGATDGASCFSGRPKYIIDMSTGDKYLNDFDPVIRLKFLLIMSTAALGGHLLIGIIRLFFHLYMAMQHTYLYLINRDNKHFEALKEDLIYTVLIIPTLILLACIPVFGILFPLNARKLYASVETFIQNSFGDNPYTNFPSIPGCILAPCMHPKPAESELKHFFGGSTQNPLSF